MPDTQLAPAPQPAPCRRTGERRHSTPDCSPRDEAPHHGELLAHLVRLADDGFFATCLLYPDAGFTSDEPSEQRIATRSCRRCPALAPCRAYGLENPGESGVYGGLTERERRSWGDAP